MDHTNAIPVVKVYGLGKVSESDLRNLHRKIVNTVAGKLFEVKSENDLFVWFPSDCMSYGLGQAILVELQGLTLLIENDPVSEVLGVAVARTVKDFFPNAQVQWMALPLNEIDNSRGLRLSGLIK